MSEMYQKPTEISIFYSPFSGMTTAQAIEREGQAVEAIRKLAREHRDDFLAIWQWGDDGGGGVLEIIAREIGRMTAYEQSCCRPAPAYKKKKIDAALRTQVFERDEYRCRHCGTHKGLTCDHIHPESKGGATTLDNLQTLCKSCNSKKGVKV